jgi:hypothetical protein
VVRDLLLFSGISCKEPAVSAGPECTDLAPKYRSTCIFKQPFPLQPIPPIALVEAMLNEVIRAVHKIGLQITVTKRPIKALIKTALVLVIAL